MVSIIRTSVCDVIQSALGIEPKTIGYFNDPLGPEGSLCIDIYTFTFPSPHIDRHLIRCNIESLWFGPMTTPNIPGTRGQEYDIFAISQS
jgi:hypothetical protein